MAEYVFTKIKFSPEHKEYFHKILTECEKDEVHPKAVCNKLGRFYKADFEKIIPLPYYWQRINDRTSNGTLIKEIRQEFDTFLDIINKFPNENNIEVIIKSFIGFIKKSNLASNFKATRANIAPYEFETLEERLRSRFECGLQVDIQSPDYETRMTLKGENMASERKFPATKLCLF